MRRSLLLGRLLFGGVFIWAAVQHMIAYDSLTAAVAAENVPYPQAAVALATLLLALGGASIVLGFMPRIGLGLIMLFLVPVTFVMHAFWAAPDPGAKSTELAMFMKNLALLGACFGLFAIPVPWPQSVDEWLEKNGHHFGGDALARGWRRLLTDARRALQHVRPRSRPSTQSLARVSPVPSEPIRTYGSYVTSRWAAWNDDGSVIVQSTRSFVIW